MQAVFYVMAIMGCGDGNVQCSEARVVPVQYHSMAECRAALPVQLSRNTDIDFPEISALCRSASAQMAKADTKPARS